MYKYADIYDNASAWRQPLNITKTYLHGTAICITGPLWLESVGHWWISLRNTNNAELMFCLLLGWISCWTNKWFAYKLRSHTCNVTLFSFFQAMEYSLPTRMIPCDDPAPVLMLPEYQQPLHCLSLVSRFSASLWKLSFIFLWCIYIDNISKMEILLVVTKSV